MHVTGIPDRTLHNWQQRGFLKQLSDTFSPGGGRRLYSMLDIFAIAALHELTRYTRLPPSDADEVMGQVVYRVRARFDKESPMFGDRELEDCSIYVSRLEDGVNIVTHGEHKQFVNSKIDHPFILIPIDRMINRIGKKLLDLVKREIGDNNPDALAAAQELLDLVKREIGDNKK